MPINHGLHYKPPPSEERGKWVTAEEREKFRYGIYRTFDALKMGSFLLGKPEHLKAAKLEYHFQQVCQRFLFSLQRLGGLLPQLLQATTAQPDFTAATRICFEAECAADHVLSYLNSIVDDIAQGIILATGVTPPKPGQRLESMGDLKHPAVIGLPALAPVQSLLHQLDDSNSWWALAFKPHQGGRQLILHNHHLVKFQVSTSEEQVILWSLLQAPFSRPGGTITCSNFLGLIHATLASLFEWLDQLEAALTAHLLTLDPSWSPPASCPFFLLPVGYPVGTTTYEQAYFPVPLCDDSDPLPWSVTLLQ
jgi:hypothetical protein